VDSLNSPQLSPFKSAANLETAVPTLLLVQRLVERA
jgi:hypothetical protein